MWSLNRGTLVDRYRATEHPTPRPRIKGPGTPGPKDHTYGPWFKSTLLLFLRLLLSTKKRWPAKPFFFSSSRKNRPQRMVYYRFTDVERTVRTHCGWRGSVKNLAVLLRMRGVCSPPGHVCFSASLSARGPL